MDQTTTDVSSVKDLYQDHANAADIAHKCMIVCWVRLVQDTDQHTALLPADGIWVFKHCF